MKNWYIAKQDEAMVQFRHVERSNRVVEVFTKGKLVRAYNELIMGDTMYLLSLELSFEEWNEINQYIYIYICDNESL